MAKRLGPRQLARRGRAAADGDRQRLAAGAAEERRGAELAERDRRGEAGAGQQRPAQRAGVDLPPGPDRRGAQRRRRGAQVAVGSARSTGTSSAHDERRRPPTRGRPGRATIRPASRTAAVSKVISMPRPIVTADVPSGSINPASSSLPDSARPLIAMAARKPITVATTAATSAKRSDAAIEAQRVDAEPSARPGSCRRAGSTPSATSRRRRRTSGAPARRAARPISDDEAAATTSHERAARRRRARLGGAARRAVRHAARRCCRDVQHDHDTASRQQLHASTAPPRHRRRRVASLAGRSRPRASDCVGAAEQLGHAERREAEQEDHRRGRPQRRPQQRQHDQPGGAGTARRRGCAPRRRDRAGSRAHHRSDESHDHGDVEEDVGDDHRRAPCRCHEPGSRARNAAPTTTVGSTNGTVATAISSATPAEAVAGQHVRGEHSDDERQDGADRGLPQP